jgi:hypothetical protein
MINRFFWVAFAVGLVAVAWIALGFVGSNWMAFAMTLVIAGTYLVGAHELRQHRAQSAGLRAALNAPAPDGPEALSPLAALLDAVPPALRNAVQQRIEAGRGSLPGPAITPYLVGLLVMLGMLGTFLGMVVTFKGAVFALEGSTDLMAIRSALAEPIRGLGLSFGTSVAGVAASAMLGLMSAISRRERLDVSRLLDLRAAGELRTFTLAHQQGETMRAVQTQAAALPAIVERLDAMMERIEQRGRQLDLRLLDSQQRFHHEAAAAYSGLAKDVGASLQVSLAAGAKAAGDSIRPVIETAMANIVQDSQRLHERLADTARAQVDVVSGRFDAVADTLAGSLEAQTQRAAERADAQATRTVEQVARLLAQSEELVRARVETESSWLDQHAHRMDELAAVWRTQLEALRHEESLRGDAAVARLGELQTAAALQLAKLGAELEAPLARLLATASEVPQAAAGVLAQLRAEMSRLAEQENLALQERTVLVERLGGLVQTVEDASRNAADMAVHASASAVELSSWGEAFGQGVQMFHAGNEKLALALQQVEGAVTRSTARSDEQLAYYVAQAREVIDLSIASQHGVIERLRELAGKPIGLVNGAVKG